ncbi:MAG: methyltransferase domain-containing protein [Halioglobus sp.]|jgi:SAM-dependent methyltransferase|nr:methyltransferase domain-containing protein [Halioglobus sp.]
MTESGSKRYLEPYRRAVEELGAGFEATLWNSRAAQLLRFDVMIDLAGFEDCVVVDIGCGQGDLAGRLIELEVPFKRYVGVDAISEMITLASQRELCRSQFQVLDAVAQPTMLQQLAGDVACLSGTLNTMDQTTACNLVRAAFDASAQGVVFNFLSDRHHDRWSDKQLEPARRFNTVGMLDWALQLSSRVAFTQSYLDGHDATIAIWHD